jgi:hypothetical protein
MKVFVFVALIAGACVPGLTIPGSHLAVGPATPRPNVAIAPEKRPAKLVLGPAVADAYVVPKTGSVNEVPVRGWRGTLEAGYASAFPAAPTGRTLTIEEAELSFSPAAAGPGGTAAVYAVIRFKARVVDETGTKGGELAGTAQAREADVSPTEEGMTDNAAKAVEAMYEVIVAELLSKT